HVAQAVCTASRAALLTGCYPTRIGLSGAILPPEDKRGLHHEEVTLPELLKQRGYASGIIGKWHLGHGDGLRPLQHGFDEWFGLPYSHDMCRHSPVQHQWAGAPLPLYEGDKVVDPDLSYQALTQITTRYTERAIDFISRHKEKPFFLYIAHSLPHVPLVVSGRFEGRSGAGLYADVIQELDASVGAVLDALDKAGLEENTLVLFTSDNGPWLLYGNHAGSAGPFREGKQTTWEGGVRVPFVARWKGKIPAGLICEAPAMTIDLFPTIARLTGTAMPPHKIDGLDIWDLLSGATKTTPPERTYFFYNSGDALHAVRRGPWKLVLPHTYKATAPHTGGDGKPGVSKSVSTPLALYHLGTDPGEITNVIEVNGEIVAALNQAAEVVRSELGDKAQNRAGSAIRPSGRAKE
ncbi:MAG TPA: sulfatase, partial [Chthoniobacteraceae bacterium]